MKIIFLSIAIFSFQSSFAKDCQFKTKDTTPARKFSEYHTLFVRCHPTRNLVFSNEIGADGHTLPVMINMDTGAKERFIEANDQNAIDGITARQDKQIYIHTEGLDAAPSPSGNRVYAYLYENGSNYLGVFDLAKEGPPKLIGKVEGQSGMEYDYPSPVYRDGKEMIMYRSSLGLKIMDVVTDAQGAHITNDKELCPNLLGDKNVDRPYMSGDGKMLGIGVDNQMQIINIDWAHEKEGKIPCTVNRMLPSGAGKASFSSDNTRIAFHTDSLDSLGKQVQTSQSYNAYVMNVNTGAITPITKVANGQLTEFPAFCGNDKIVTRVVDDENMKDSEFRLVAAPTVAQGDAYVRGDCAGANATQNPAGAKK
jgi:hypothetical protein